MTTTRMTFGSVLGTSTSAATTVTSILDTATTAVGMATAFVDKAANEQRIRYAVDKEASKERIVEEAGIETLQRAERLKNIADKSEWHKQQLSDALAKYSAIVKDM